VSNVAAQAFAEELRARGLTTARPAPPGVLGVSGAERRLAGGLGPTKVDVSWTTEESGLLLAISVKTINFRDRRSGNFQKNLCQRPSVPPQRRPSVLPAGGHVFSALAAIGSPQRVVAAEP